MTDCCDKFKHFRWQFGDALKRYPNHPEMQYKFCPYCGTKHGESSKGESEEQNIARACEEGDRVLEYLVEKGLVGKEMLHQNDEDLDPSGFTEEGRDLFEFIYNIVRNAWEDSQ